MLRVMLRVLLIALIALVLPVRSVARDRGQFAASTPEMKKWFDELKSGKGPCCSDADGSAVSDADWEAVNDPSKPTIHYRVRIENQWWDVEDSAVITEPNRVGRTMVWPIYMRGFNAEMGIVVRCFMPGAMI
jgi:hypothetical protein